MFLAAMADLGLDIRPVAEILTDAGVPVRIEAEKVRSCGLTGTQAAISPLEHEPPLRTMEQIEMVLAASRFSAGITDRAHRAFERLARAEAAVHGVQVSEVHFHEVGAVDTLADIVGCFWALEQLGVNEVSCSPLPWFQGRVECAHGVLPLPAPATVELLKGKPMFSTSFEQELITPTGALLVDQTASGFGPAPDGTLTTAGIGWGRIDLSPVPNGVRAFLFAPRTAARDPEVERVVILESNVDHLTGEEIGSLYDPLLAAGALDVIYLPGVMKKNRSGGLLQVLCRPEDLDRVQTCFVDQTMTLGLRRREAERIVLVRRTEKASTALGPVASKAASWRGATWSRPEHEALEDLARKTGRSVVQLRYMLQGLDKDETSDSDPDHQE
jgi:hypothetical protein